MIDVQTLSRLKAMRLSGMVEYFENLTAATGADRPTGPEMVKMAVDWEYERRRNSKLHRLRRHAALAQPDADIGDIKAMPGRSVDTELIARRRAVRPHHHCRTHRREEALPRRARQGRVADHR